jgi:hypothetical protein
MQPTAFHRFASQTRALRFALALRVWGEVHERMRGVIHLLGWRRERVWQHVQHLLATLPDGDRPRSSGGQHEPGRVKLKRRGGRRERAAGDRQLPLILRRRPERLTARATIAYEAGVDLAKQELFVVGEGSARARRHVGRLMGREVLGEEAPQLAFAAWFGEWDRDLVHLV